MHRTTRRLTLTEAGRTISEACVRILAEIDEAEAIAGAGQAEPQGRLRMSVPVSFGTRQIAPLMARFAARHLRVQVEFDLSDRDVDLADLAGHNRLGFTLRDAYGPGHWSFGHDGSARVPVAGSFLANNGDALCTVALAGLGIVYQPTFLVGDDIRAGRLVALTLDRPPFHAGHVQAVFLRDRRMPLKTRSMIDFLVEAFGAVPPWDQP